MKKIFYTIIIVNPALIAVAAIGHMSFDKDVNSNLDLSVEVGKTVEASEQIEEGTKEEKNKNTLSDEEMVMIELGRNPFSVSPEAEKTYDEREYLYKKQLEKIQAQKEKEKAEAVAAELAKQEALQTNLESSNYYQNENGEYVLKNNSFEVGNTTMNNNGSVETDNSTSEVSTGLTKQDVMKVTNKMASKYSVEETMLLAIIEEESSYDEDLERKGTDTTRRGIMQTRADKEKFIMESLGIYYDEALVLNMQMNIEMGTWYLGFLLKESDGDIDYALTTYYYGEQQAISLKKVTGSYKSDFSLKITKKMEKLKQ